MESKRSQRFTPIIQGSISFPFFFDRETRDILIPTEKRVQQREKAKERNYKTNQTSEILALKEERLLSKFENARMI